MLKRLKLGLRSMSKDSTIITVRSYLRACFILQFLRALSTPVLDLYQPHLFLQLVRSFSMLSVCHMPSYGFSLYQSCGLRSVYRICLLSLLLHQSSATSSSIRTYETIFQAGVTNFTFQRNDHSTDYIRITKITRKTNFTIIATIPAVSNIENATVKTHSYHFYAASGSSECGANFGGFTANDKNLFSNQTEYYPYQADAGFGSGTSCAFSYTYACTAITPLKSLERMYVVKRVSENCDVTAKSVQKSYTFSSKN